MQDFCMTKLKGDHTHTHIHSTVGIQVGESLYTWPERGKGNRASGHQDHGAMMRTKLSKPTLTSTGAKNTHRKRSQTKNGRNSKAKKIKQKLERVTLGATKAGKTRCNAERKAYRIILGPTGSSRDGGRDPSCALRKKHGVGG